MRCLEGVYFEILKNILLACYLESIIKSGPWYADLDGDADVDAASVQRLQYAIPSARLPSTATITVPRFGSSMVLHYRP